MKFGCYAISSVIFIQLLWPISRSSAEIKPRDRKHDEVSSNLRSNASFSSASERRGLVDDGRDWFQVGQDIDGSQQGQQNGQGVAINFDGSRVATGESPQEGGYGKVRIWEKNRAGVWRKVGGNLYGDTGALNGGFGESIAMSYDGTRLIIGAPSHGAGYSTDEDYYYYSYGDSSASVGRAYIYIYDEIHDDWEKITYIEGIEEYDYNGQSVAMSADGTRVVIGAPSHFASNGALGQIRVYEEDNNGQWVQLGNSINGDSSTLLDRFGWEVSISHDGKRVAGGAIGNDDGNSNAGKARIFEFTDGDWNQVGGDINGVSSNENCGEGLSLSFDGSRVAVGSPQYDNYGGRTRMFELMDSEWIQIGEDIDGVDNYPDYQFSGESVSLSADGTRVAISANHNSDNGERSGHIRIFDDIGGEWMQVGSSINGEFAFDYFGNPVVLSANGETVAAGAIYHDGEEPDDYWVGHVRVFEHGCEESAFPIIREDGSKILCADALGSCDEAEVASHCPNACQACSAYACADSEVTFFASMPLTCSQITNRQGCNIKLIKNTCRASCGLCD